MFEKVCYIINFNAKDYVLKCVDSVMKAINGMENIEVCVVDNASSDGSVEALKETYGSNVRCVVNQKNLGGAGGFNTALNDAIKNNVKYAVLLDNDIVVDEKCIKEMIQYLKDNSNVGAVGAKIMIMDKPNYIQEFGGHLDMENYYFKTDYWYEEDNDEIKDIESEWLSSCALAVRMDAAKKTNLFPEENFLFWDDIQFTWEIKKSGYRLVSLADAKVWHKGKKKEVTNTATAYYAMRNRTKFFSICVSDEDVDTFCKVILEKYFDIFFGSSLKGLYKTNSSRMMALNDFINKRYGKIPNDALWEIDLTQDKLASVCNYKNKAYIKPSNNNNKVNECVENGLKERFSQLGVELIDDESSAELVFVPCEHISQINQNILPEIWIDKYLNCITTEEDYSQVISIPLLKRMFVEQHYDWLMKGIFEERNRNK